MIEQKEIAIHMEGVKKKYKLGKIGRRTLQEDLQSWWAQKRGKEDPNLKIGTEGRQIGKQFWALNGINLTIYKGERIGIIGRNGAGKSTLLKILSRITAPTEGQIRIRGRISSLLEVDTGFYPELTGKENIYMKGAILGMKRSEIDSVIDQIIDFSEVRNYINTPVKRYSSGMYVKLGFAVAAFLKSEILIMDEVLAVGDMAFQNKCLTKMQEEAEVEGKTILYVSHNMNTIRQLCNRCIVLDQGKIIYDGDVEEAISIYMNENISDDPVNINLESKTVDKGNGLTMKQLNFINKVMPIYEPNEALEFQLTMTVDQPKENLYLRLTFRNRTNVGIGTAWSHPFSLNKKGSNCVKFSMPLRQHAKGNLYVSIGIYQRDELGRNKMMANVTRAFCIEVEGLPTWNISRHGYVSFPEISVF